MFDTELNQASSCDIDMVQLLSYGLLPVPIFYLYKLENESVEGIVNLYEIDLKRGVSVVY